MYTSLRIQNFRGLRDLHFEDLGRVNLIVGANNVGKTSVLEALFLLQGPGNPTLSLNLAGFRGYASHAGTAEQIWQGLFRNFDPAGAMRVIGRTEDGLAQHLEVRLSEEVVRESAGANGSSPNGDTAQLATTDLATRWVLRFAFRGDDAADEMRAQAFVADPLTIKGQYFQMTKRLAVMFPTGHRLPAEDLAERFTRIVDGGRLDWVRERLAHLVPGLNGLSLGYSRAEGGPVIRADVEGAPLPVPLYLLGEGANRVLEWLLTIPTSAGGLILIDEIGAGVYSRNLTAMWQALDEAARSADVQLFATTHSWECLGAAVDAFAGEAAGDLRVHRLEREEGEVRVVTLNHEETGVALDLNLEVR